MSDMGYLTIGKVVAKLKATYPDLSVSKVRFLEDEGLLTPSRTPGGYRLYSPKDVERLETILYLQKSKFLPLSVIKDQLDGNGVTSSMSGEGSSAFFENPSTLDSYESTLDVTLCVESDLVEDLHPIDRMPQIAGVPISLVRKMSDCGLIRLRKSPAGRDLVDGHDLHLIKVCSELGRFGIEPKNLRQYVTAANREIPMIEQALVSIPRQQGESEESRQQRREESLSRLLALTSDVRSSLIKRELSDSKVLKH